jgi:ubiquinone/menaquinone biosynthesis C-methylase UbiE
MKMSKLEKKFVNRRKREEKNIQLIEDFIVQSQIDLHDMSRALDLGCGVGFVARYLNDRYDLEVVGVDVDPEQIRFAKEYKEENEGLHFAVADATQLPFEDNHFDLVLSFMVIHHVGDWGGALEEVDRVLKPKGVYLFYEITYPGFVVKAFRSRAKNYGIFTKDELMEYLDINNYQVIYKETKRHLVFRILGLVMRKD